MWTYEHRIETTAPSEAIWQLWADVPNWGTWNSDIEQIKYGGSFSVGAEIVMVPAGQDPVRLCIADLTEHEMFVDEARIGDLCLRTTHQLHRIDDRWTEVVYRMEITGPTADEVGPQIGPAITADWPETMASLVTQAQK